MKNRLLIPLLVMITVSFACNLPSSQPQNGIDGVATYAAQTVTAAAEEAGQSTSQPEIQLQTPQNNQGNQTPQATSALELQLQTPATQTTQPQVQATATNTPLPCNRASFVEDVTVPDNTSFTVNKAFTKTWRLKNVGSCTWTSGYLLVFDSGDQMSGPVSQQLTNGTVAPGQTIDVSVNLVAPGSPGTYKGNWKIKDSGGVLFALSTGPFWVQIKTTAGNNASWPTYEKGDTGVEVYAIQHLLRARGFNLNADGIFGPDTQSKVEDFQTQNNLNEDAIVGPETWEALIIQVAQGKTGESVRAVQKLLKEKFGYNINVDGIFGPATAAAVKDFQTAKGLASDGIVGPLTWQKLINE